MHARIGNTYGGVGSGVRAQAAVEECCCQGWRNVHGASESINGFIEGDVPAVVREELMVGKSVENGARGTDWETVSTNIKS